MLRADVAMLLLGVIVVNLLPFEIMVYFKKALLHIFILFWVLIEDDLRNVPFSVQNEMIN